MGKRNKNELEFLSATKCQDMGRDAMSIKQIEYKNAELVMCEFMAVMYDDEKQPKYKDFNLQEFHDFVADKIDALDAYMNSRKPGMYKTRGQSKKSTQSLNQI